MKAIEKKTKIIKLKIKMLANLFLWYLLKYFAPLFDKCPGLTVRMLNMILIVTKMFIYKQIDT